MRTIKARGVLIQHNTDWSGDAFVVWQENGMTPPESTLTAECKTWRVIAGCLTNGELRQYDETTRPLTTDGKPVPIWVIAVAIALAVRASIADTLTTFVEDKIR